MCEYTEIEKMVLSNGKTVKQINSEVSKEVERIYLEGWANMKLPIIPLVGSMIFSEKPLKS